MQEEELSLSVMIFLEIDSIKLYGLFFMQRETLTLLYIFNMGVSKNRGTPKWMVYNGKP